MTFKIFNLNYWFAIAGNLKHAEREKEKTESKKKKKIKFQAMTWMLYTRHLIL